MSYLLDTNVVSEWRKAAPNPGVDELLSRVHVEDLFVSVVTIGEVRRGISRLRHSNDHRQAALIESWLVTIKMRFHGRIIPVSLSVAEEWGEMVAGAQVAAPDALIAATALVHGWTLATRNVKDFRRLGVRVLNPFTE